MSAHAHEFPNFFDILLSEEASQDHKRPLMLYFNQGSWTSEGPVPIHIVLIGSPRFYHASRTTFFKATPREFRSLSVQTAAFLPTSNNAIPFISGSDAAINVIVKSRRGIANTSPAHARARRPLLKRGEGIVAKLQQRYDDTVSWKFHSFLGIIFWGSVSQS